MYIPEEKISEVMAASDIVDVISESVILKKKGRNFFGLCPFHSEKTPSFSVNPAKQIFHCFGCSEGGNVVSYVMKYHGLTFPDAVKMLARKHRIQIDTASASPAQKKEIHLKESLFRLNKTVMAHYTHAFKNGSAAAKAREYLRNRGITDDIIEQFKLGWADNEWDNVVRVIKSNKITRRIALQSGLVLERKKSSGYYDRFRNRVMFPIFDINMQIAGFGGRVMDDSMPKYMNSPETPVYNKSRILYGLHASKPFCRQEDTVFIVEGYFDFLSLFQHGIKNTVASLGTALTSEHVRILKGYASKMTLVFDSDAAGIKAAKRSVAIFLKEGVDTRILVLPEGNDPDSFVMDNGAKAFMDLAAKAKSVMQFLLQVAVDTHGMTVEGRMKILDDMKTHLITIEDTALRSLYIKELAETLKIDERAVLEKVKEQYAAHRTKNSVLHGKNVDEKRLESDPREEQLISMMLNYPLIIGEIKRSGVIDCFFSDKLRKLAEQIIQFDPESESFVSSVMAGMNNSRDQKMIASFAINEFHFQENIEEKAKLLINRMIKVYRKRENRLTNKIISAKKGCNSEILELLKQRQSEIRQLHNR